MTEEEIYEQIYKELNGGNLVRSLWTRVYAELDGDEAKAKARYIKERASQLLGVSKTDNSQITKTENTVGADYFAIPPIYCGAQRFSDGVAAVKIGQNWESAKWGYINAKGEIVIAPQFDRAGDFENGYADIQIGYSGFVKSRSKHIDNLKTGFIDKRGNLVIPPIYEGGWYRRDRNCFHVTERTAYGVRQSFYIDYSGKKLSRRPEDDENEGKEGLAIGAVFLSDDEDIAPYESGSSKNEKIGFFDKAKLGKWGFINRKGQWVIKPQFGQALHFSDGFAPVLFGDEETGKWGYINLRSEIVIKPQFEYAHYFDNHGTAKIRVGKVNGKYGWIDKAGQYALPPIYDFAGLFINDLAVVGIGQKWGVIDRSGKFVVNPIFDNIDTRGYSEGLIPACVDISEKNRLGLWGYICPKPAL